MIGRLTDGSMAKRIDYEKPAQLLWQDFSKLTTGVSYLCGQPHFEGTLAEAVRNFYELPRSCQSCARIHVAPQPGLEKKTSLQAADIDALRRRKDFPRD